MKQFFLMLLLIWSTRYVYAQKKIIDSDSYAKWQSVVDGKISNNGKYVLYSIKSGSGFGSIIKSVLTSIDRRWKLEISGKSKQNPEFSTTSQYCVFTNSNDSLGIITLGSKIIKYIPNVASWTLPRNGVSDWLSYKLNSDEKNLFFLNLKTGKKKSYSCVESYEWSNDGKTLILQTERGNENKEYSLKWINVNTDKEVQFWKSGNISSFLFDAPHEQLAIQMEHSIWLYKPWMIEPDLIVNNNSLPNDSKFKLGRTNYFSNDGNCLFTTLESKGEFEPIKGREGVEVWSYTDRKIQSVQESELDHPSDQSYIGVVNLRDKKLVRIQRHQDEIFPLPFYDKINVNIALTSHKEGENSREGKWKEGLKQGFDLVDKENGARKELNWLIESIDPILSPMGKFITFFDKKQNDFFSYEVSSGIIRNLTKGLKISWLDLIQPEYVKTRGRAVWLENDKAVLICDSYDIWKLDPFGKIAPVNLTNGYGAKHHVVFNFGFEKYENGSIPLNEKLILNAFNLENKYNGFYSKSVDGQGDPELLTMGPYIYHLLLRNHKLLFQFTGNYPSKARDENIFLVKRSSSSESSNYFTTKDFKIFHQISNIQPEKLYNWYTTELHNWKSFDGRKLQGILYKPENFDPSKKYPVIFNYYEKMTGGLNAYIIPEFSQGNVDIPTFVSNGYLVFCPDIYYQIGDPMQGTYNAVVSAGRYLSNLPFVDSKKMGLQGHSWGGVQTNYLVTSTSMFAAACSASGVGDWISIYGSLRINENHQWLGPFFEEEQPRMGGSLWEKKNIYIKNSSFLNADKISTPLLIMHTKKDGMCLYSNVLEYFLGLRRLGKKAWMLAYPEGSHSVHGKESEDFTIRMQQFFDHYLKDQPAPLWMLDGVAAKDRDIKTGLELDQNGRTPGPGLLNSEEQKKVDSLMIAKPVTLNLK